MAKWYAAIIGWIINWYSFKQIWTMIDWYMIQIDDFCTNNTKDMIWDVFFREYPPDCKEGFLKGIQVSKRDFSKGFQVRKSKGGNKARFFIISQKGGIEGGNPVKVFWFGDFSVELRFDGIRFQKVTRQRLFFLLCHGRVYEVPWESENWLSSTAYSSVNDKQEKFRKDHWEKNNLSRQ